MLKRAVIGITLLSIACAEERPNRSFVQEHALRKDAFQGDWYYATTGVEAPYAGGFIFPGLQDSLLKVRWKIEKDHLFAYSTYTTLRGAERDLAWRDDGLVGEPVAAFRIDKHFDIRHSYSAVSGEEYNVIEENTSDRFWHEREYMRVDWSSNSINRRNSVYGEVYAAFGMPGPDVQPVTFFVEDGNHPFAPKFDDYDKDGVLDYIDIVHQVTISPTAFDVRTWDELTSPEQVTIRNSFVRIEDGGSDYEPLFYPDSMWERFGYFRNERGTFDQHRGETDFLDYYANRHNIWQQSHTDVVCDSHADCGAGSKCDHYHSKCTIPYTDRELEPLVYHETVNYPEQYRVQNGIIARGWNRAFQSTVNTVKFGGQRLVACLDDAGSEAQSGLCCTEAQRTSGSDLCVPDMFIVRPNNCRAENVQAYLENHGDLWSEVERYTDDGEINSDNLVRVCGALEAASRRAGLDDGFRWEQLGDLRYNFFSYVHSPARSSPLGYGPTYVDPETGESISANANVYGAALETYKGYIGDAYDLIDGAVDSQRFAQGEHVREYFQRQGFHTGQPNVPEVFMPKPVNIDPSALEETLRNTRARLGDLEEIKKQRNFGMARKNLAGTYIEEMLINDELALAYGLDPTKEITDDVVDQISPFRGTDGSLRQNPQQIIDSVLERHNVFPLEAYTDFSIFRLIQEARKVHGIVECQGAHPDQVDADGDGQLNADEQADLDARVIAFRSNPECRDWSIGWIMDRVYRAVMEHEVGHTVGLRHNFEGSFDEEGYPASYWAIKADLPDVRLTDYDSDGDGEVSDLEHADYVVARRARKREQELAGVDQMQYSSIMDYSGQWYGDLAGVGRYDLAAIKFGYGEIREVYDGDPNETRDNRMDVKHWEGGEICLTHADCPAHDPKVYQANQQGRPASPDGVTQTCGVRENDEGRSLWVDIDDATEEQAPYKKGFCSNWDEDMERAAFVRPRHGFCSDERVADKAHCSRFDEGPSSVDIVENMIETYERQYIFNNFRRYRRWFGSSYFGRLDRYYHVIGKQFQAMVWRLFYYDGFATDDGPGGYRDMFTASLTAMNFFSNVITRPVIGPYIWNEDRGLLVRCGRSDDEGLCSWYNDAVAQYDVTMGNGGKYLWTSYQEGYYGAFRTAQIGTFLDKWMAVEALTTRSWDNRGGNNESIPLNYYDAFGDSMLDVFAGLITENYDRFAAVARFDGNQVQVEDIEFRDFWYGTFFGQQIDGNRERGFENPEDAQTDRYAGNRLIDPSVSIIHRIVALINSLALFSSFRDTTYADYVQLKQYDATWVPELEESEVGRVTEYRSPLRGKVFRAIQSDDNLSITSDLVALAEEARQRYEAAGSESERRRARNELESAESFLNIAADIIRSMGVSF